MPRPESSLYRPTYAEISLKNLGDNARWLQSLSPHFFCPMLKSNAYGHGDVRVARHLSQIGIKTFGLALIEECLRLRKNGLTKEQLLVFGSFDEVGAQRIIAENLTPVLSRMSEIAALKKHLSPEAQYPVHIKINTGMARLGFDVFEAALVKKKIGADKKLKIVGVCSHLSHGEDAAHKNGHSARQVVYLKELQKLFGEGVEYHLYNSSSALALWAHDRQKEIVFGIRPGISLYGVAPEILSLNAAAELKSRELPLKAVLSLKSGVVHYHQLKKGQTVSYGGLWTASRPSVIAVVPIGYADGFARHFSNRGKMLFRGQRVTVAGRVCMDYTMIDLTDVLGTDFGDYAEEIVLIGHQGKDCLKADEMAAWSDTISYEILTSIGRRVPRKYVE